MTKEEQQAKATLNDHIVIHKVTDNILAMHKDGTAVYAVDVIKKPLVICKECKYEPICIHSVQHTTHEPTAVTIGYKSVDYCSYGERKGE